MHHFGIPRHTQSMIPLKGFWLSISWNSSENCYGFGYSYNLAGLWNKTGFRTITAELLVNIMHTHLLAFFEICFLALWRQKLQLCQSQFGNQSKRTVPVHVEFYCVWFWSTVTHSLIHLRSVSPSMPGAIGSLLISGITKHTTYLNEVSTHPLFWSHYFFEKRGAAVQLLHLIAREKKMECLKLKVRDSTKKIWIK